MTEETPGFEEKPDVPSGATPDDAEPKADDLRCGGGGGPGRGARSDGRPSTQPV
ncbi:hypothetical protein SAURM35S_01750 [Streptomyces aurantiogriseus]